MNKDHDAGLALEDYNYSVQSTNEDDLYQIPIYWDAQIGGTLKLELTGGQAKIGTKVYTTASKDNYIDLSSPKTWDLSDLVNYPPPSRLFMEGVQKSAQHGDVTWKLTQTAPNGSTIVFADEYHATVYDLTVTSAKDKIWVNNDDDDPSAEDDLEQLIVHVDPQPPANIGSLVLKSTSSGGGQFKLWSGAHKDAEVTLPYQCQTMPQSVWMEGTSRSSRVDDVKLRPSFTEGGWEARGCETNFTICQLSLGCNGAIMTGGVDEYDGIHSDWIVASGLPNDAGGTVQFSLDPATSSGEYVSADLDIMSGSLGDKGEVTTRIRSSDAADDRPVVKAKCGGDVESVTYQQVVPARGVFEFWPESLLADGISQADIDYRIVWPGTNVGVPGHHIAFRIVGVTDLNHNSVPPSLWGDYASVAPIWPEYITTDPDGYAVGGVLMAGTEPGIVSVVAEDADVWTK